MVRWGKNFLAPSCGLTLGKLQTSMGPEDPRTKASCGVSKLGWPESSEASSGPRHQAAPPSRSCLFDTETTESGSCLLK